MLHMWGWLHSPAGIALPPGAQKTKKSETEALQGSCRAMCSSLPPCKQATAPFQKLSCAALLNRGPHPRRRALRPAQQAGDGWRAVAARLPRERHQQRVQARAVLWRHELLALRRQHLHAQSFRGWQQSGNSSRRTASRLPRIINRWRPARFTGAAAAALMQPAPVQMRLLG